VTVDVRLVRFCARCGTYEVKVTEPISYDRVDRETWLAAQHAKAARLRAPAEPWRCARCGYEVFVPAGPARE
jgi:ribosomal protein S27AE